MFYVFFSTHQEVCKNLIIFKNSIVTFMPHDDPADGAHSLHPATAPTGTAGGEKS